MSDLLNSSAIDRILCESSEEDDNFEVDFGNESAVSDELVEENPLSDESEIEGDGENNTEDWIDDNAEFVLGKDGETIWCLSEVAHITKTKSVNIVKKLPGTKQQAKHVSNELEAFLAMISVEMIDEIVECTNRHIMSIANNYERERDCKETNRSEIMALFGVLYLIGTKKGAHANVRELWATDGTGIPLIRAAMGYKRFLFVINCMRFDNKASREHRKQYDKLAPIRFILDSFQSNCINCYSPSEFTTIDEMLHRFRGRCSFVQYIPNKPAKYGLKMFALCDSKTFYCSNFEVYCGKQPDGPYQVSNSALDIVKRLVKPIEMSNRNVTTDNWYTSMPLADYLLSTKLTLIGTMKKNKAAIPPAFLPNKTKVVGSAMYGFQDDKTLVSYVTKKNKGVVLLSTMHHHKVTDEDTGKPEIIIDYNQTKGGVDTCDKMCASYSVSRVTRRWPMALFFVFLNIASINARVILLFNNNDKTPCRRKVFQKTLALNLMKEHLEMRASIRSLPQDVSTFLKRYRNNDKEEEVVQPAKKKGTCWTCGRKKNSPTTMKCNMCSRFVCKEHSEKQVICSSCKQGDGNTEDTDD